MYIAQCRKIFTNLSCLSPRPRLASAGYLQALCTRGVQDPEETSRRLKTHEDTMGILLKYEVMAFQSNSKICKT